jgi:hypothetical protein
MEYKDYLKTDHWKEISSKKKKNGKCGICGSKENLNVHHIKYTNKGESVLFNETHGVLRILCEDCHHMWHRIHGKLVYRVKHAGRIKYLMTVGYSKEFSFINCVKGKYTIAKRTAKATGGMVAVATQKRSPAISDSVTE